MIDFFIELIVWYMYLRCTYERTFQNTKLRAQDSLFARILVDTVGIARRELKVFSFYALDWAEYIDRCTRTYEYLRNLLNLSTFFEVLVI